MEAYARHEFSMSVADKNGVTAREHLEQARKAGASVPELDGPAFPYMLDWVWQLFLELHSARPQGVNGPSPIGYNDLVAWSTLYGVRLMPWEVTCIRRLDKVWHDVISERPLID